MEYMNTSKKMNNNNENLLEDFNRIEDNINNVLRDPSWNNCKTISWFEYESL